MNVFIINQLLIRLAYRQSRGPFEKVTFEDWSPQCELVDVVAVFKKLSPINLISCLEFGLGVIVVQDCLKLAKWIVVCGMWTTMLSCVTFL